METVFTSEEVDEINKESTNYLLSRVDLPLKAAKKCNEGVSALLSRLKAELKNVNNSIYHLVNHAGIDMKNKEHIVNSLVGGLSVNDFRDYIYGPSLNKIQQVNFVNNPEHLIKLSNMISAHDVDAIAAYYSANKSSFQNNKSEKSFYSFAISNMTNDEELFVMTKQLSSAGYSPTANDIATAIDLGKSIDFIDRFISRSKGNFENNFDFEGYSFNLSAYSSKRGRYDLALHFYHAYGIQIQVDGEYGALDFIDFDLRNNVPEVQEIISLAVRMSKTPYDSSKKISMLNYLKRNGLLVSESYEEKFKTNYEINHNLADLLDSEKMEKLNFFLDKSSLLNKQIEIAEIELKRCSPDAAIAESNIGEEYLHNKENHEVEANSEPSYSEKAKKIFDAINSLTTSKITDAYAVKKAFDYIEAGDVEVGISEIDSYLEGRPRSEKNKIYNNLMSLHVPGAKSATALRMLTDRGAEIKESTIFMFLVNENLDAIELYKEFHDIGKVKDARGLSPVDVAKRLKLDSSIISRLQ